MSLFYRTLLKNTQRNDVTQACIWFCLSRYSRYLSIVQINPFRPHPSYSATNTVSSRFNAKIFSLPAVTAGLGFFLTGPQTRSRRPCRNYSLKHMTNFNKGLPYIKCSSEICRVLHSHCPIPTELNTFSNDRNSFC